MFQMGSRPPQWSQEEKKHWFSHPLFGLVIGLSIFMILTEAILISFCLVLFLNPTRNPFWSVLDQGATITILPDWVNIILTLALAAIIFLFLVFLALGGTFFKSLWPASRGFRDVVAQIKWWDPFSLHYKFTAAAVFAATVLGFLSTLVRLELVDPNGGLRLVIAIIPVGAVVMLYAFAKAIMAYTLRFVGVEEMEQAIAEQVRLIQMGMRGETELLLTAGQEDQIRNQARVYKPPADATRDVARTLALAAEGNEQARSWLRHWQQQFGYDNPMGLMAAVQRGDIMLERPFGGDGTSWTMKRKKGSVPDIIGGLLGSGQ